MVYVLALTWLLVIVTINGSPSWVLEMPLLVEPPVALTVLFWIVGEALWLYTPQVAVQELHVAAAMTRFIVGAEL